MTRIALLISILLVGGCSFNKTEYTNDIYLIPEGYEGSIIIFYGIPGKPVLKQQGDFSVISVEEEFLESMARSKLPYYGISFTSTPLKGGLHNDKFFYIDSNGGRTSIQEECFHHGGIGSLTNKDGNPVEYRYLQITKSECSQEFWFDGKDSYYDQLKEVKDYWFNELY